jgi:hypothetical protein
MQDLPWHEVLVTTPLRDPARPAAPIELTTEELGWVAGGLNPQPLPPGIVGRFD